MDRKISNWKHLAAALLVLAAVFAAATGTQAAWKNTKAGRIYTTSGKPGYCTGWKTIDGAKYYFNKGSGVVTTGWKNIKAGKKTYRYYFGDDGKMRSGFFEAEGYPYYANSKGRLQYGHMTISNRKYYADPKTGILARNQWLDDASGSYYFLADCSMAVNQMVHGNWIGADGRATRVANQTGFIRENRKVYYYERGGRRVTGWLTLGGKKYYLSPELRTGWFSVGKAVYYADGDGSVAVSSWKGKKYLTSSGVMAVGWTTIKGSTYYFDTDGNAVTGAKTINGKNYRFDEKGVLRKNYWYTSKKGARYYYGADGSRSVGLTRVGSKFYYFSKNGKLKYGWISEEQNLYYAHKTKGYLLQDKWIQKGGKKYYALSDCRLAVGLTKINGKIYVFSQKGVMYTKTRRTVSGKTYYLGADGVAVSSSWRKIKGKYYYFGVDGVMVKNTVVDGYMIDENGVRGEKEKGGWVTKNGKKYYVTAGKYATGLTVIDGGTYFFSADGVMQTGIQDVGGKKRYFYPGGTMAKGVTLAVGSKVYTINASGVVTSEKTIDISGNSKGSQMAKFAVKYVGNKYVYGGTSLTNGADCSGFVYTVHASFGITIPRVADDQMKGRGVQVPADTKNLLPGDLIFYGSSGYASHVAMYIGNGQVVHASNSQPYPAGGIKISNYNYSTPIRAMRYWS